MTIEFSQDIKALMTNQPSVSDKIWQIAGHVEGYSHSPVHVRQDDTDVIHFTCYNATPQLIQDALDRFGAPTGYRVTTSNPRLTGNVIN